jgi:hypothetical protein
MSGISWPTADRPASDGDHEGRQPPGHAAASVLGVGCAHGKGDFSPVFKLKLARKDLQLAAAMAEGAGLPSACAKGALAWYDRGHDAGHDNLAQNAIILTTNPELRKR